MSDEISYADDTGAYRRDTDYIETRITRDGADGWPVEAGRYRLAAARACPWANRALIARRLYGLEDAISLALAGPTHGEESWNSISIPKGPIRCSASTSCVTPTTPGVQTPAAG